MNQDNNSSKSTAPPEQKPSSRQNSRLSRNSSKSGSTVTLKNDSSNLSLYAIDQLLKQLYENDVRTQQAHKLIK